jgi:hypothetical protein
MNELLTGFASEIFRPIITLLLPVFWGTIFIVVCLFLKYPDVWKFANDHKDGFALVRLSTARVAHKLQGDRPIIGMSM